MEGENVFTHFVKTSQTMSEVLEKVQIVGQSDTTVLILGESGTGKELAARAIHCCSARKNKPLVVVNCAALPFELVESTLFGHERGAFTNAFQKRIGKFELASGGTIFLDEIGEMAPDLQVKLLRVLQEQEIEPIGGKVQKINVRIIAATNRKLDEEVAAGRFRLDLYYRLNVFPIELPPLRNRKADIVPLADHFLKKLSKREGKLIEGFSPAAIGMMLEYPWPGNVRELENIIERSVLLCDSRVIGSLPLPVFRRGVSLCEEEAPVKTMQENEREHVLSVLRRCNWKVSGPGGAAQLLDINAFTLKSRMKKLGIKKEGKSKKTQADDFEKKIRDSAIHQ